MTYQMASGTNQYHGSLFEINRNSFFDSVGFFNGPAWRRIFTILPRPIMKTTTGSPSAVPSRFPRSTTVVTGPSVTTARSGTSRTMKTQFSTVPTALQKTGDFSDFVDD